MGERDAAAMWAYHDRTKHSLASLRRDPHVLDWANMPRPFKVYPELPPIPLPRDFASSTRPVLAALADAGDTADGTTAPDLGALARLLYFAAGVIRHKVYPGGEIYFRAAACTGALYHVDLYLVCGDLPGLAAGVYQFAPHDFALRRLRAGDHRGVVVTATDAEPAVTRAPALLVFTTTFWRNAWKYRERAYRHAFWDSGTILANLLAVSAGVRLPVRIVLGFVDDLLDRLLDLDTQREVTLGLVAIGGSGTVAPPAPALAALGLATLPVSAAEVDYPAIRAAHEASAFTDHAQVAAWRRPLPAAAPTQSAGEPVALAPLPTDTVPEPVETVILRRGSTRAFARDPIAAAQLATILRAATRGIPTDFAAPGGLADPYLIVHAVDGLAAGTYAYDRGRSTLQPLRAGGFRREAMHLGLGQELPGDAAVDIFWLADLRPILAHFGGRGYRAAQLSAAIEGGKAYLAAYALGLGATGLTFFDDDVTDFLSPHAAGKSVLFLVAVGRPARQASRT